MSFHLTQFMTLRVGDLVRPKAFIPLNVAYTNAKPTIKQDVYGFSDHVILGFDENGECKLSRPYAYVSLAGTTGPTVLLGAETYTMRATRVVDFFDVIESGRTR